MDYRDISFFARSALELDILAKAHNITTVVDCGVAPGMSNMICGAEVAAFERSGGRADFLANYGVLPPERLGGAVLEAVARELGKRGIRYQGLIA